ncbi:MAG TPA: cupin domain-containing protein [Saprospiraceae bacterium]|nr:cupin domain-containing protein [Saprospiraceae bacterium]
MLHKKIASLAAFTAGDATTIREVLHPKNEAVDLGYSLAEARLEPGKASYPHVLEQQSELYLFVQGQARVHVGEEQKRVQAGEIVLVPAGVLQYVENIGAQELVFYCIVNPPWKEKDEQVFNE